MTSEQFKKARQSMGLTQTLFAGVLGITQPRVSDFESGKRKIPEYIAKLIKCILKEEE